MFTHIYREREISKRLLESRPQKAIFEWKEYPSTAIFNGQREISLNKLGQTAKSLITHVSALLHETMKLPGKIFNDLFKYENTTNTTPGEGIFAVNLKLVADQIYGTPIMSYISFIHSFVHLFILSLIKKKTFLDIVVKS